MFCLISYEFMSVFAEQVSVCLKSKTWISASHKIYAIEFCNSDLDLIVVHIVCLFHREKPLPTTTASKRENSNFKLYEKQVGQIKWIW